MRRSSDFPFEKARRVTPRETEAARRAIERVTRKPRRRRGRRPKPASERYRAISIRLHPKVLAWAKQQATRRGLGYQSVINAALLEKARRR